MTRLLNSYFSKFKLAPVKNEEDVRHWLVPRDEVVYSYVKIDERTNEATDFCSFYNLSSTVIQAPSKVATPRETTSYSKPHTAITTSPLPKTSKISSKTR